jgi:hypothetical protein
VTERLAYKIHMPAELQQLSMQMLDQEGFCHCGRLIRRLDGKFMLAAIVPSKETTILAAYCQPCSQIINACLHNLRKAHYIDQTPAINPLSVPRRPTDVG